MATTHSVKTTVHGTYLVEVPAAPPVAAVVGFHGYGEAALDHLAALRRVPGADRWLLCAVQALHPFYTRSGQVVASWMTKLDREHAIADNTRYVGTVVERLTTEHPGLERLAFSGFSQGVAMAWRAAAGRPCDALVALAGDVPPDVAEAGLPKKPAVLIGRGTEDTWYDDAKLTADLETLRPLGIEPETCVFAGGHEWSEEFLQRTGEFLRRHLERPA
ncbi:MAG TPA: phospholipase [Thermoanaerobaculia bacterium]|nr:phospholipase [Thermoanaerobaculia bacterium]